MLYLGIDQHARQITISVRDENGDVLQAWPVSTQPERINAFFQRLTRERLRNGESFVAVLEVCGFNDWLIRMLQDYRCHCAHPRACSGASPRAKSAPSECRANRAAANSSSALGQPACKPTRPRASSV